MEVETCALLPLAQASLLHPELFHLAEVMQVLFDAESPIESLWEETSHFLTLWKLGLTQEESGFGDDLHSNPRFVSFGQVSSFLSSHCCTWKTGDHADFTGLLPGLTDREYSAMSSRL